MAYVHGEHRLRLCRGPRSWRVLSDGLRDHKCANPVTIWCGIQLGSPLRSLVEAAVELTYSRNRDAESDRNSQGWGKSTGIQSGSGKSSPNVFAERPGEARFGDRGVLARHLVTELRETHGPV